MPPTHRTMLPFPRETQTEYRRICEESFETPRVRR